MLGRTLEDLGYRHGLHPAQPYWAVKAPVFSFAKLVAVDIGLGPEMKSTGEIMGVDAAFSAALLKAMIASGVTVPDAGTLVATIADRDKQEAADLLRQFADLGFRLYATKGTARFLDKQGVRSQVVKKIREGHPNIVDLLSAGGVDLVVNTISRGKEPGREGARIRRASVEHGVPCLTSLDTTRALLYALSQRRQGDGRGVRSIGAYLAGAQDDRRAAAS
jgi:carbamoyl-phosphate synthase large subunit